MLGLNEKKEILEKEKEDESESGEESEAEAEESEAEEESDADSDEAENEDDQPVKKMKVERGKPEKIDENIVKKKLEDEENRLRVMMIPRKHRGLYQSMTKARKKRVQEAKKLERKRKFHDEEAAKA